MFIGSSESRPSPLETSVRTSFCCDGSTHATILRQVFHVKTRRQLARIMLAILFAIASPAVVSAQLNVLLSGGFAAAYKELLPEFERTSHITVTTASGSSQGNGPNTIGAQLARRVATDVVVMNKVGL